MNQSLLTEGSLESAYRAVWAALEQGRSSRRHGWHQAVLATLGSDHAPRARAVILRHADPLAGEIGCHTDVRSPKVRDIRAAPAVEWCLYDPETKVQARLSGPARVLTDGPEFEQAWEATRLFSRRCYLAPNAPSSVAEAPDRNLPPDLIETNPSAERSEHGRANFAVIRGRIDRIDVYELHASGHLRAGFSRSTETSDSGGSGDTVQVGDGWCGFWLRP